MERLGYSPLVDFSFPAGNRSYEARVEEVARQLHAQVSGGGLDGIRNRLFCTNGFLRVAGILGGLTGTTLVTTPVEATGGNCIVKFFAKGTDSFSTKISFLDATRGDALIKSEVVRVGQSVDVDAPSTNGVTYEGLIIQTPTDRSERLRGNCKGASPRGFTLRPAAGVPPTPSANPNILNFLFEQRTAIGLGIGVLAGTVLGGMISRGVRLAGLINERNQARGERDQAKNDLQARTQERDQANQARQQAGQQAQQLQAQVNQLNGNLQQAQQDRQQAEQQLNDYKKPQNLGGGVIELPARAKITPAAQAGQPPTIEWRIIP